MKQNEQTVEKKSISEKLNSFFSENRKIALSVFIAIVAIVLVVIVVAMVLDSNTKKSIAQVETIMYEFEKFKSEKLLNSLDSLTEEEKNLLSTEAASVIEKLKPYQDKKNYAGFMANQLIGDIYFGNEDFENALQAYEKIALDANNYTSGVSYFNAAACADELGQAEKAVQLYTKASEASQFPFKERALFNAARVQETLDVAKAIELYNKVVSTYPNTEWASLSKTRLIELELN